MAVSWLGGLDRARVGVANAPRAGSVSVHFGCGLEPNDRVQVLATLFMFSVPPFPLL